MYLVSVYFDEKTSHELERLILRIATNTGNDFMIQHHVPPHMTISSFESKRIQPILDGFSDFSAGLQETDVQIVSPGMLLPYVLYAAPVFNEGLHDLNYRVDSFLNGFDDIKCNRYYRPYSWLPHITLGKTLTKEQMQIAFQTVQQYFVPVSGMLKEIGIAKTNPHMDIIRCSLK